jgi:hypothetical protein
VIVECTDLFVDAEWACAHVMRDDMVRINIQQNKRNMIYTVHVRISKISNFLEQLRRAQNQLQLVATDTSDPKPS